ncbi:hypothetical protein BHU72_03760 [Desulfuribacillus stibiiarsenatis]|uniref:RNHCP domain-containing protein n=1 Tax=Desulfuribacillus stibiiarsenatis TaxID=1390249 RepID=A0A1E5L7D5_9FIRM|nr:RNHCP domain-containing protein [Desulfuribacillus stibiiarsenatis]OEH85899.1 hypothetical protein BHU72_03760 [Desulfuribacillus stibiiarsenatis]
MTRRKTTHINESFTCENCGFEVPPIKGGGCRNHCPSCLVSKHLDNVPGDRESACKSLMDPVDIEYKSHKGYMILHKCRACGMVKYNKAALDTLESPDCLDEILKIMKNKSIT